MSVHTEWFHADHLRVIEVAPAEAFADEDGVYAPLLNCGELEEGTEAVLLFGHDALAAIEGTVDELLALTRALVKRLERHAAQTRGGTRT
ncbi:hypothetical protein [Gordonia alkanivorans]|uniref:hypothetical protein n=1 Tax=Gordonia alkanivorans TaxID=84096 RepID=UPI0004B27996|nr:hypothetical protein [Gordonia alkanivorans]